MVASKTALASQWTMVLAGGTLHRALGAPPSLYAERLKRALEQRYGDQIKASHDGCWCTWPLTNHPCCGRWSVQLSPPRMQLL